MTEVFQTILTILLFHKHAQKYSVFSCIFKKEKDSPHPKKKKKRPVPDCTSCKICLTSAQSKTLCMCKRSFYNFTVYYIPLDSSFQTPDSLFMNGSPSAEAELLMNQSLLEQSLLLQGRRRGRKRKEEKMAEIAMAEALARRQMARAVASFEPGNERV